MILNGPLRLSRRDFLKASAASAALCVAGCKAASEPAGEGKKIPIGLQLYSVRKECEKDLPGVIEAVAAMGYEGVEFAGYYGQSADELRAMLDSHGLKCCGTHAQWDTLLGDELPKTIEFNKTLGNPYLIVPGLPQERQASIDAWLETAKLFNEISEKVKPHGMRVGYHNHTVEFQPIDGQTPWDVFFGNTDQDVIMQFDTGNAMHGGADALPFLRRYPGRAVTVHLKEYSETNPDALVGDGDIPWKEIFETLETTGGTRWYIVEYEREGRPPLKSVELCLENLRKMGK